jgi:hypothetical protein
VNHVSLRGRINAQPTFGKPTRDRRPTFNIKPSTTAV